MYVVNLVVHNQFNEGDRQRAQQKRSAAKPSQAVGRVEPRVAWLHPIEGCSFTMPATALWPRLIRGEVGWKRNRDLYG